MMTCQTSTESLTSSTITQSSPLLGEQSRGSSVSTEMREEYEDLLRYAVVVPLTQDAKMASRAREQASSGGTAADLSSVRARGQPEPARLKVPKPHPSPLYPEVKVVDSENSSVSEIPLAAEHPRTSQAPPTALLDPNNRSLSLQASLDTPPPHYQAPPPFTAMNVRTEGRTSNFSHTSHVPPDTSHEPIALGYDLSHDQGRGSHDQGRGSHDQLRASHDQGRGSHDQVRGSHDQGRGSHDQVRASHDQVRASHDMLHDRERAFSGDTRKKSSLRFEGLPPCDLSHDQDRASRDFSHDRERAFSGEASKKSSLRYEDLSCDVSPDLSHERERAYSGESRKKSSLGDDPEMTRLGQKLDTWCYDLKRNILAEFEQSRIRLIECQLAQFREERENREQELDHVRAELDRYKELLGTYEQSIGRKDHVISNLTRALQKQKEKVDLQKTFGSWKLRHVNEKRECFTSGLALEHYRHKLKGRVWEAWFGIIRGRWKQRIERACQRKAEEVVVELTGQYEDKLAQMNEVFEAARQEIARLKAERDLYEENMKKSFMRGVCALNMEAMSMFKHSEDRAYSTGDEEAPLPPPATTTTTHPPPTDPADRAPSPTCTPRPLPHTIADMRPIKITEGMGFPPPGYKQPNTAALPINEAPPPSGKLMPSSILVSRMQHQQGTNREPVEVQWVGGAGEGASAPGTGRGKSRRGMLRGGDQPPSIFVQRHSE